jgi:uncharacterized protein YutE (UPF0331/DUF86 family)
MDETIILVKIESLKRCLNRIREKIPASAAILKTDLDMQDIIILNLERAVQLCVDIAAHTLAGLETRPPQTMSECFTRLHEAGVIRRETAERLRKSVGFRNIVVHEYQIIDWDAVFAIITKHLDDFRGFTREVLNWFDEQNSNGN